MKCSANQFINENRVERMGSWKLAVSHNTMQFDVISAWTYNACRYDREGRNTSGSRPRVSPTCGEQTSTLIKTKVAPTDKWSPRKEYRSVRRIPHQTKSRPGCLLERRVQRDVVRENRQPAAMRFVVCLCVRAMILVICSCVRKIGQSGRVSGVIKLKVK